MLNINRYIKIYVIKLVYKINIFIDRLRKIIMHMRANGLQNINL